MTGVIKFSEASENIDVQNLGEQLLAHANVSSKESEITRALALLQKENDELRATIKQAEIDTKKAVFEAKNEGAKAAKLTFERDEKKALASLKDGITNAHIVMERKLQKVDVLSLAMTQAVLDNVFHPADGYREIVSHMIDAQMKGLKQKSILSINVSINDFPQQEHLDDLSKQLARKTIDIYADPELDAGECIIELRIGQLEFSATSHWKALVLAFKMMSAEASQA